MDGKQTGRAFRVQTDRKNKESHGWLDMVAAEDWMRRRRRV